MKVILNLAIINWTTLDYENKATAIMFFFTVFFSFKILLHMIMSRQKCQVILFVGMDAQVLKIPDYDTPENWILLRYIRDELWQLIEFCRLLTILRWILGQLLKKLSALLCTLHRFNVHTYNEAKVYGNKIGLLTEQLDTSAKISMLSLIREDLQNIRLLMLHYFKVNSFISWWLGCLPAHTVILEYFNIKE